MGRDGEKGSFEVTKLGRWEKRKEISIKKRIRITNHEYGF